MELTGIGKENEAAFAPLMGGERSADYALCVGAIEDGEAAGVALFSELGGSLILDYIYVSGQFRRRGIATLMIEETLKALEAAEFVALHVNYPESAGDIHGLIYSLGFKTFRDGVAYRTKVSDFLESDVTKKLLGGLPKDRVVKVSDLTKQEKNLLRKALKAHELDPHVIDDRTFSKELSLANFDPKDGSPAGLILCRTGQKVVTISYLVNFSDNPVKLKELLKALVRVGEKQGIEDHELVFLTMNDDMVKLPEKLLSSKDLLHREGFVISGIRMLSPERTLFADLIQGEGYGVRREDIK